MYEYDLKTQVVLKRVEMAAGLARWVWVINFLAMLGALLTGRYLLGGLAALTWILVLPMSVVANRAVRELASNPPGKEKNMGQSPALSKQVV